MTDTVYMVAISAISLTAIVAILAIVVIVTNASIKLKNTRRIKDSSNDTQIDIKQK